MADIPPGSSAVETFRVDVSFRAWPFLALGATLTTMGALSICTAFIARGVFLHKDLITHAGTVCMLVGPLLSIVALRRLLQADEYVAALDTGLLVHLTGIDAFMAWPDVERVAWDAGSAAVVVTPRAGDPISIVKTFGRAKASDVAAKLDDVRRKAAFGLR